MTAMAAPVPWACCAVLAAATAVVYTQRHSPQEAPHVQYERLGSDVTLPCGTANWDAAVTWRVNGTDLAPDLLNGSQLVLHGLELGHSGLYACFHRDSWHLRHQVLLHVGLPPREPVLSCRSNTYPKGFYCSWHLPTPTYIPNTFNVTVLHGSKIMVCEKDPALKNRCHIRYMHLFSTIKYKVSISVSNALGHNATAITFDEFTIGAWGGGGPCSILQWECARGVYEHWWGQSRVCLGTWGMCTRVYTCVHVFMAHICL
ncbi:ciliary neurotrophic factor receptor subunit alpha [Leptonychotes weddellii]|uniref:Ciliary neurotrophic factor receptor subunit alpha n=1 Tax=Leptonychotes weddellii TaxID=9713 RepID=A0A7F8QY80_LEPWE|nr:ciliary neurotrophic factor receptor subunit alpha [Leptonychotes weddellii]